MTAASGVPSWAVVAGAVIAAFPCGWGVGVILAYLIAGKDFGQLPALTVPLGLVGAIAFALWPSVTPRRRFTVLAAGALLLIVLAKLVP